MSCANAAKYVMVRESSKKNGEPPRVRSYGARFGLYVSEAGSFRLGSVMPKENRSLIG